MRFSTFQLDSIMKFSLNFPHKVFTSLLVYYPKTTLNRSATIQFQTMEFLFLTQEVKIILLWFVIRGQTILRYFFLRTKETKKLFNSLYFRTFAILIIRNNLKISDFLLIIIISRRFAVVSGLYEYLACIIVSL